MRQVIFLIIIILSGTLVSCDHEKDSPMTVLQKVDTTNLVSKVNYKDSLFLAKFTLSDSTSIFKYCKKSKGLYIYTKNGIDKERYDHEPFVVVSELFPQNGDLTKIAETLVLRGQSQGVLNGTVANKANKSINGYNAFEFELNGFLSNDQIPIHFYYFLIAHQDKIIVIQIRTDNDLNTILPEVKKLAYTIKIK